MAEADLAGNILKQFEAAGAVRVEPGYLQSADVLLDLYGENIRARAYITHDPVHGEQMLRPDFTVPVVRRHMEARSETPREPARYTYAGPVWRRQDYGSTKAREFWQVGYEVFDGSDPSRADAEVFALIASVVSGKEVPVTGDLSFLFAAIDALETSQARKDALKRHVWRPNRFERLLKRFSGEEVFACDVGDIPELGEATHVGLRSSGEIKARLEALKIERETEDLSQDEVAFLMSVLSVKGPRWNITMVLSLPSRIWPVGDAMTR